MNRFWLGVLPILWILCERSLAEIADQDAKPGRILVQAKNDQIDSDRIRVFYDKRKNLIAYKNLRKKSCFLEKVTGNEKPAVQKISRTQEKQIRSLKTPESFLDRAKVQKLAGKKIWRFCENFRTSFIKELPRNRKDLTHQELETKLEKENIFESLDEKMKKTKAAREKRQIRPRFRGQTQSQFMSFGDGKGSAEAVSQPDISKTIVSGVNGIGQAQSQSGGRDCDGCYPEAGGTSDRRFETGRDTGRPGGETRGTGRDGTKTSDGSRGIPGRDGSQTFDGGRGVPGRDGSQTPDGGRGIPGSDGSQTFDGSRGIPGRDGVGIPDGSSGIAGPGVGPGGPGTTQNGKDFIAGGDRIPGEQGRGSSTDSGVSGGRDLSAGTPGRGRGPESGFPGPNQAGQGGTGEPLGPGGRPHYPGTGQHFQPKGGSRFSPSSHGSDFSQTNGRNGGSTIPSQGGPGARYPPSASSRPHTPMEGETSGRFPPSASSKPGNGARYPPSASSKPYPPIGGEANGRFPPSASSKPSSHPVNGRYPPSGSSRPYLPGGGEGNGRFPPSASRKPSGHPVNGARYPPSASSRPYSPGGGEGNGRYPPSASSKPSGYPVNGARYPPSASSKPYSPVGGESAARFPPSSLGKPTSDDRRPVNGARYPPSASSRPYSPGGGEGNGRFPPSASSKPSGYPVNGARYPPSASSRPYSPVGGESAARFPPSSSGKPSSQDHHPDTHGTGGRFPSETDRHTPQGPVHPTDHGPSYRYPPSSYEKPLRPDSNQHHGTRSHLPPSESDLRPPARYPPSSSSKPYYPGSSHEPDRNGRGPTSGSVPSTDRNGLQNGFRPDRYPPSSFSKPLQPDYYPPSSGSRLRPQDSGGRHYPDGSVGGHPQYEAGNKGRPSDGYGEIDIPCETDTPGSTDGLGTRPGGFPVGGHGQEGEGGRYDNGHSGSPSRPAPSGGGRSDIRPGASGAGYPSGTGDHRPGTFDHGYPSSRPDTWGPGHPSQIDHGLSGSIHPSGGRHDGSSRPGGSGLGGSDHHGGGGYHVPKYPGERDPYPPSAGTYGGSGQPGIHHGSGGGHDGSRQPEERDRRPSSSGSYDGPGRPGTHGVPSGEGYGKPGFPGTHGGFDERGRPHGGGRPYDHDGEGTHGGPVGGSYGGHNGASGGVGSTRPGGSGHLGMGVGERPTGGLPGGESTGGLPGRIPIGGQPGGGPTGGQPGGEWTGGQIGGQPGGAWTGGQPGGQPGGGWTGGQPGGGQAGGLPGGVPTGGQPGGGQAGGLPGRGPTGGLPGGTGTEGTAGTGGVQTSGYPGGEGAGGTDGADVGGTSCPQDEDCKSSEESQVQTSVTQDGNATRALSSAQGRFKAGIAQAQVSGIYTGSGSFSAQAQTSDNDKGAQVQVIGGSRGASSSAQGMGGRGQTQAQVQLGSKNGATSAEAQSGGLDFATNTQVQAGAKGGSADAQADGPGRTSSQAQIGFTPYVNKTEKEKEQKVPFQGGVSASAQSGANVGQSQTELFGSFYDGISYTGSAQAGSGKAVGKFKQVNSTQSEGNENDKQSMTQLGFSNRRGLLPLPKFGQGILKGFKVDDLEEEKIDSKKSNVSGEVPDLVKETSEKKETVTTAKNNSKTGGNYSKEKSKPQIDKDAEILETNKNQDKDEDDENDDEYDEEEEEDYDETADLKAKPVKYTAGKGIETPFGSVVEKDETLTVKQKSPTQSQTVFIGGLDKKHDVHIEQDADESVKEGDILEPGDTILGKDGFTVPPGFRGKVTSVAGEIGKTRAAAPEGGRAQSQTVLVKPGTGKVHYTNPKPYRVEENGFPRPSPYVNQLGTLARLQNEKVYHPPYASSSIVNNGQKKYSQTYYTKSSGCGYYTFSCDVVFGSNGRAKICKPNPPTNPDGTPCVI